MVKQEMKVCRKGHSYENTSKSISGCTVCYKATQAKYRAKNKEKFKIKDRERAIKNKEKINEVRLKYREYNKALVKEQARIQNEKRSDYKKQWAKANEVRHKELRKINYQLNKEKRLAYVKEYNKKNPSVNNAATRKYKLNNPGETWLRSKLYWRGMKYTDIPEETRKMILETYNLINPRP